MSGHVHQLPSILNPSALGRLQLRLRRVLRAPGGIYTSQACPGCGDAGGDQPVQRGTCPRCHSGVRPADHGETPLSPAEVEFAIAEGLIA